MNTMNTMNTDGVFIEVENEMCGLEWGRLYETYHTKSYNPAKVLAEVQKLYEDSYVSDKKGIFEFILGGSKDTKLLNVRVFNEATKKSVYATQTKKAKAEGNPRLKPRAIIGRPGRASIRVSSVRICG